MNILYTLTSFELFIGGGGRLFTVGPLTLRMILFAILIGAWFYTSIQAKREWMQGQKLALVLVAMYCLAHFPALFTGTVNGYDMKEMFADLQQSLYWFAAPFFAMVLSQPAMVEKTARIVQVAGGLLAVLYLGAVAALSFGLVNFFDIYAQMSETNEFFFRNESLFFYKGFLYLGIAMIFSVALRGSILAYPRLDYRSGLGPDPDAWIFAVLGSGHGFPAGRTTAMDLGRHLIAGYRRGGGVHPDLPARKRYGSFGSPVDFFGTAIAGSGLHIEQYRYSNHPFRSWTGVADQWAGQY